MVGRGTDLVSMLPEIEKPHGKDTSEKYFASYNSSSDDFQSIYLPFLS